MDSTYLGYDCMQCRNKPLPVCLSHRKVESRVWRNDPHSLLHLRHVDATRCVHQHYLSFRTPTLTSRMVGMKVSVLESCCMQIYVHTLLELKGPTGYIQYTLCINMQPNQVVRQHHIPSSPFSSKEILLSISSSAR